jgi:hypothetical protein
MTRTDRITPSPPEATSAPWGDGGPSASVAAEERPTFREMLDDVLPVIGVVFVAGPPVVFLAAPWLLLVLMLSGPFALLVAFAAVGFIAAALLVCVAALLAAPVVLVRRLRRRHRSAHAIGIPAPRFASAPLAASRRMLAHPSLSRLTAWNTADVGYVAVRTRGEE